MTVVATNYMFTYVYIRCQGCISDSEIFENSSLWHKLEAKEIMSPLDETLPSKANLMPYVF